LWSKAIVAGPAASCARWQAGYAATEPRARLGNTKDNQMQPSEESLNVNLGERSYPILIQDGALGNRDLTPGSAGTRC